MFYLIVLLILKVAFFVPSVHFGRLAYLEIAELADMKSKQTMAYNLTDKTNTSSPEVVVEMPTTWRAGESQLVKYELVKWGNSTEDITLNLYSSPALKGFGTPITFMPGGEMVIEKEITIPSDAVQGNVISAQVISDARLSGKRVLGELTYVTLVSSNALRRTTIRIVEFVFLFLITLVIAVLVAIYFW
jgi:hypothetical protein